MRHETALKRDTKKQKIIKAALKKYNELKSK